MKQNLRFLMLALLCAVFSTAWGTEETITFSEQGFSNGQEITSISGTNFSITFAQGTNTNNAPKYYTSGTAIRAYGGNYFTVSSSSTITKIVITFGSGEGSNEITTNVETYSNGTWEGSATDVTFTIGGSSGHRRLAAIAVTLEGGSQQLTGETYEIILDAPASFVEGDYVITGNSTSQKYAMTNVVANNAFSGTEPPIDGNANVITDDKTMVWHIAPQGDYWSIQSLDDGKYAANNSGNATMTSTLDENALWSYNGNNGFVNKVNNAQLHFFNGNFSFTSLGSGVFTLYRMPDKYYVAGTWTEWATDKIEMTKSTDGTYTLANQGVAAEAQFKIIKVVSEAGDPIWYGGEGNSAYWITADNHTDISLFTNDAPNFYMPIAGTWTFTVDPTGAAPKLTVAGDWPVWEYYLKGDFNDWEAVASYKFSQIGETGKYSLNKLIKKGETFKIYGVRGNEEKWFGAVSNGDFYVENNLVGTAISLTTENGGEDFYMNLSNKKYWELEFDPGNMTLTLNNFISDIAELPFEYDGGRNAIENTAGLTSNGLGNDYSNSPKMRFDTSSQYLTLHFNERPGTLSFDIKSNGFSEGTFQVLTSTDGENYDVLKEYTSISAATTGQHEIFNNLGENVRYIKWLYKQKVSGNVALGNIVLEKYVAPEYHTLTINSADHSEIFVFYNDSGNNYPEIEDGDEVLSGSEVLISIDVEDYFYLNSLMVTDEDGQELTLTKDDGSWTFTMPKSDVTISYTVKEYDYDQEEWVLTDLADLTEDDIFVIVGFYENDPYAMINHNGDRAPETFDGLYISGNREILRGIPDPISDEIKWNVSGNATDGYIFYPNGDHNQWLYATNTNNGVRVGTGAANLFTLTSDGYLTVTVPSDDGDIQRYIGIYNGDDWRCYTSINSNIQNQTFGFYKYVKPETFEFSISDLATDGTTCYATISALGDDLWIVKGNVEVSTVVVENNVLTYPFVAKEGDKIPGNGAYLVKGNAGDYTFEKSKSPRTIDIGDNMLMSTGNGNITTTAPTDAGTTPYLFYKLARNANKDVNSVGFYFGADNGGPFRYGKGHQAYLAVPNPTGGTGVQSFSFDGTGTGINDIVTVPSNENEVYTLSGMRVNSDRLQKGLYIVNGKKVVIK